MQRCELNGGDTGDGNGETDTGDSDIDDAGDDSDADGDDNDGTGSNGGAPEPDEDDSMPGFTTGAGVLGGAATLEWLRRKAGTDDSAGVDQPAE